MKPPICEVCSKRMGENDECKLLYFKKGPNDLKWDKKASKLGFTGHPPYAAWFCPKHLEKAQNLTHLTLPEAIRILKKDFG